MESLAQEAPVVSYIYTAPDDSFRHLLWTTMVNAENPVEAGWDFLLADKHKQVDGLLALDSLIVEVMKETDEQQRYKQLAAVAEKLREHGRAWYVLNQVMDSTRLSLEQRLVVLGVYLEIITEWAEIDSADVMRQVIIQGCWQVPRGLGAVWTVVRELGRNSQNEKVFDLPVTMVVQAHDLLDQCQQLQYELSAKSENPQDGSAVYDQRERIAMLYSAAWAWGEAVKECTENDRTIEGLIEHMDVQLEVARQKLRAWLIKLEDHGCVVVYSDTGIVVESIMEMSYQEVLETMYSPEQIEGGVLFAALEKLYVHNLENGVGVDAKHVSLDDFDRILSQINLTAELAEEQNDNEMARALGHLWCQIKVNEQDQEVRRSYQQLMVAWVVDPELGYDLRSLVLGCKDVPLELRLAVMQEALGLEGDVSTDALVIAGLRDGREFFADVAQDVVDGKSEALSQPVVQTVQAWNGVQDGLELLRVLNQGAVERLEACKAEGGDFVQAKGKYLYNQKGLLSAVDRAVRDSQLLLEQLRAHSRYGAGQVWEPLCVEVATQWPVLHRQFCNALLALRQAGYRVENKNCWGRRKALVIRDKK